jgi:hypothetical protein
MACPYHQQGMPKRGGGPGVTVAGLRRLREQGEVTSEVARRLHHDLDLEESRLERERRG